MLAVELTWVDGASGVERPAATDGGSPATITVDGAEVAVALERASG